MAKHIKVLSGRFIITAAKYFYHAWGSKDGHFFVIPGIDNDEASAFAAGVVV
jgi:hypothetical protein